jgi:hypothetical protein
VTDRHTQPPEVAPPPPEAPPPPGPEALPPPPPPPEEPDRGGDDEPPRPQFEPISRHAPRFRLILGALIGVAIGAIGATLVLVSGQGPSTHSDSWSSWQPSTSSIGDGAQQIADHVAPTYRQQGGDQLVGVTGGPLKVAASPDPLPAKIAVASQDTTKIGIVRGSTAMYNLCGLGSRCAINRGKPSAQRFLLLRREALELALYSFRYLDGVKQVVVFLPPPKGKRPSSALFFRADDNRPELQRPLRATLAPRVPSVGTVTASPDAALVDQLTEPTQFRFSLTPANQDNSAFLVLDPFDPSAPLPSGGQQVSGSGSGG